MRRFVLLVTLIFMFLGLNSLMAAEPHQDQNHADMQKEKPTVEFPTEVVEVVPDKCPVMGGKIDKAVFSVYRGHIYYFCCPGCISAFNADPEKYLEKFADASTRTLKVTNTDGKSPDSELEANLEFFKIDEKALTITFYHDQKTLEKAGE